MGVVCVGEVGDFVVEVDCECVCFDFEYVFGEIMVYFVKEDEWIDY